MGINMDNRKAKPMKPAIHLEYFSKKVTHTSPCGLRASPIRYARGDWANSLPWGRARRRTEVILYPTLSDGIHASRAAGTDVPKALQANAIGTAIGLYT